MTMQKKWLYLVVGGVGALALAGGVLFVVTRPAVAAAGHNPGLGWPGDGDSGYKEALADALGITVEELDAAYESAREAAIQQAVDEGLITQEQADQFLSGEVPTPPQEQADQDPNGDVPGRRGRPGLRGGFGVTNELLAQALGISVEELEAAQEQAFSAMITQAVEGGTLTQDEADLMLVRMAVRPYVDAAMAEAYTNAVQQAVSDGAITQAQADQLLSEARLGFPGFGDFFGGRGGMPGGFGPFERPDHAPAASSDGA